jgi:RNA polymerase sigma factor
MEAAWLLAAKSEDESAFLQLQTQYEPMLRAQVAWAVSRSEASLSQDCYQEALVAFHRAIMTYQEGEVTFGLYAKICVKNRLRSFLRKYRRQAATATLRDVEPTRGAIEGADYSEQLQALRATLSPWESEVLSHLLAGEKPAQISRSLCRPPKAVYNALVRIRRKRRGMTQM